ncbi:oligomeric complex COG6 [Suillus subalutaceus]|uniref:oligomeric complex COG6 n=1 Tax=Suillus subalutaceus TaxID=48586 RepID=UPI001B87B6A8|nr:oligomeric complex COG6 [Suillus subalutaceus]KAG1863597.1 oligomeric complex COG6 [Suillus subalutaceus]
MSVQARSPVPPPSSLSVPSRNAGTPVSASQTRNPITIRLRKILGTNFIDEATTEALRTLSELYGTQSTSVSGSKAQTNGTDSDDDWSDEDADVGLVVEDHREGLNETASRARKNLRRDLENKLAQGSQQFLQAFSEVDQKLDELQNHVAAMRIACDEAETQLRLSSEASQSLLDRAESLRSEREEVEMRKSIVMLFLNRFTLNDEEAEAITSRDVPIGPRFFEAMNKTEHIRNDCRVLMSGEDGPTKAGLDIMASTSSYLEQGYEKIYRWCSFEFRQMGRDTQLEVDSTMQQAICRLSQRPELLSEALAFLTQARQTGLLSAFLDALTRGGPSGLPRPIELHAHDPIRYVGDMLAWVHQAIAAECEFLESLFGLGGGQEDDGRTRRMVGAVRTFKGSEEEGWVKELLNSAVMKLCVPLKVRVQQTVRSQESSIVSYKVANLLQYYMLTMRRTIGEDALLSMTLSEITDVSYKVFFDAIEAHGRALLRISLVPDDPSLTPPLPILEHAQLLREIMQVYDSSLLDDTTAEPGRTFNRILDVMLDPAMEMCAAAAEEKARYRPQWDRAVFVLNCWCYLQNVLEAFEFTSEKRRTIQEKIDGRVKSLEDEHYENILRDASLYDTVAIIKSKSPSDRLSHVLPAQQLQPTLARFSLWLSSPEVVHSPRLSALTSPSLHSTIHRVSLARVTKAYAQLCEEVRKPENRYEAASTLLGMERPFGQAGVLWAIFGLEEESEEFAAD